mmetsp:Transcript_89020/g.237465  ORF Transcript_89020/g.237465 Transcript_89020/m.237465 type:complete len:110 (-) Transcript_89020:914-1243(-)
MRYLRNCVLVLFCSFNCNFTSQSSQMLVRVHPFYTFSELVFAGDYLVYVNYYPVRAEKVAANLTLEIWMGEEGLKGRYSFWTYVIFFSSNSLMSLFVFLGLSFVHLRHR